MVSRIILAIAGVVLIVAGVLAGVVAVWGYTSIGTDGLVRIPAGTVTPGPNARATIIDVDTFTVTAPYVGGLGSSELVVTSPDATAQAPLFIGAALTADADAFLSGVPYAAAFREGEDWTVREVPGGVAPPAPAVGRWLTQATGAAPAIAVPADRPLSLVVLAPDGSPVSSFDLAVAFTIPDASSWLLGLAIAAGVLVLVGAILLILAVRRRRVLGRHAAGAPVADADAASDEAPDDEGSPTSDDQPTESQADEASEAGEPPVARDDDATTELPVTVLDTSTAEPAEEDVPVDGVAFVIDVDAMTEPESATEPEPENAVTEPAVEPEPEPEPDHDRP